MLRTHTCGELKGHDAGKTVHLCGWVDSQRIQGKLSFILLRDRYGITQVFVNPELTKQLGEIRRESVLRITGEVKKRPENQVRTEMSTGEIELVAKEILYLNEAEPLPMELDENIESAEEVRLKYRFLDLRKNRLQKNLILRHKVIMAMREFLDKEGFLELETPILGKSTPEGARDYLVPSRIHKGQFYALPQSPQLFKQLFMVAGYDRYFQIARCFRDEDNRSDRQPEFTQLDLEMSFVDEHDVQDMIERLLKHIFKQVMHKDLHTPFKKLTYKDAMEHHQSDKPDLRENKEDPTEFAFEWVTDFPLLEWNEDDKRFYAMHHPFTSPKHEDVDMMESEPGKVRAKAYDIVLNGFEIGGGSIRIHNRDLQNKMFRAIGIEQEEAETKFGFLLNAFRFGAPPHGGLAIGIDRLVMLLAGETSIKEVIAYPKNKDARDLMLDAPSEVSSAQLHELGIKKQ